MPARLIHRGIRKGLREKDLENKFKWNGYEK